MSPVLFDLMNPDATLAIYPDGPQADAAEKSVMESLPILDCLRVGMTCLERQQALLMEAETLRRRFMQSNHDAFGDELVVSSALRCEGMEVSATSDSLHADKVLLLVG